MVADDWHFVLSHDGTVLGATGGAPADWIGSRLEDRNDVPEDLKEAGRALLEYGARPPRQDSARVVLQSTRHAVHLTVVDAVPLRREPTDLRALLRSTLDVMQLQAKALDVTLKIAVDPRVPVLVSLDADKIAWVTTTLVGNALRYVHHGSQVMPGGSIAVRVKFNSAGPELTIEIQDDGAGISVDKLPYLFSAGPDQPRVGLGLSMIREVVAAHAGHIEVHSDTDTFRRGTTIRLTLPV